MKKIILLVFALLLWVTQAWAVPVLQIGAPAEDLVSGTYANYSPEGVILSDPTEEETAVISGNTLYVAGLFNQNVVGLGGQFTGTDTNGNAISGLDWGGVDSAYSIFNGWGAILVVTVPTDTTNTSSVSITLGGTELSYITSSVDYLPNNHTPPNAAGVTLYYFDLGDFSQVESIPDFSEETETSNTLGQILSLVFTITGFDWAHFDVMALETTAKLDKSGYITSIKATDDVTNPPSHDVTWKEDGGGQQEIDPVPEPGTIVLLGCGLVGLAFLRRKQK